MRLVPTTNCPSIDAELSLHACVVLHASERQMVLLKYSRPFGVWYVCGFQSVASTPDGQVREAYYYWRNVGYVAEPSFSYALLKRSPSRSPEQWAEFYENIEERVTSFRHDQRSA